MTGAAVVMGFSVAIQTKVTTVAVIANRANAPTAIQNRSSFLGRPSSDMAPSE
jgi:hypothetical protein